MRSLVFVGIQEPEVDSILERLNDLEALPVRCLVFGSHMSHLATLCRRWKSHLDVTIVLLPGSAKNMTEAVETILENEGLAPADMVWLIGPKFVGVRPPPGASVLQTGDDESTEIARRLAAALSQDRPDVTGPLPSARRSLSSPSTFAAHWLSPALRQWSPLLRAHIGEPAQR